MTKSRVEVVTSVERRRYRTTMEKEQLVAATLEPGASVSAVAMYPRQLYHWRRQLCARAPAGFAPVRVGHREAGYGFASNPPYELRAKD